MMCRYAATNPRLFGSVARGDATPDIDIDLLVDLLPGGGNDVLRVSGTAEEPTAHLGARVDVERFVDILDAMQRCRDDAPRQA